MIFFFSDFGWQGGYVGQVEAVISRLAPDQKFVNLLSDAPTFRINSSAYLLSAFSKQFFKNDVVVAVVDPGVGTSNRLPIVLNADGVWYVGPGNGLFNVVAARALSVSWYKITFKPNVLSNSFHGRDIFAPVAAHIASGLPIGDVAEPLVLVSDVSVPEKGLSEIIYFDGFGNAFTGLTSDCLEKTAIMHVRNRTMKYARTFGESMAGSPFWYENSLGVIELAIRESSAKDTLGLKIGDVISIC